MDGILLIDKPAGPTSHDVVARMRRVIGQRSIGHTGTLDPRATGLLPLVLGRATKLASLLTGGDKTYEAAVRLGFGTETDDAEGAPLDEPCGVAPDDEIILAALDRFRGVFEQIPPSHSAKKVDGRRAYDLARRATPASLRPVTVTVRSLEWLGREGAVVHLMVTATAGFYVRALARDLGRHLGCGGHLAALRRTRSGSFQLDDAVRLEDAERMTDGIAGRVLDPASALPDLVSVSVTAAGLRRALHGNPLGVEHLQQQWVPSVGGSDAVKVLGADGRLVAIARVRDGALHPVVVLG